MLEKLWKSASDRHQEGKASPHHAWNTSDNSGTECSRSKPTAILVWSVSTRTTPELSEELELTHKDSHASPTVSGHLHDSSTSNTNFTPSIDKSIDNYPNKPMFIPIYTSQKSHNKSSVQELTELILCP